MIRLENLKISFGKRIILEDADATFKPATLAALIGRNGTGKSTLLRAIAGLNKNFSGRILIDGLEIRDMTPKQLATRLAFVNTHRPRIPNLTCREVVSLGRAPYTDWLGKLKKSDIKIVEESIEAVKMEDYSDRTLDTLSDGEFQRVMIARALAQSTSAILLDEPTSFLDIPNRRQLVALLRNLAHQQEKCIIFSTHELDIALRMCDEIALIDNCHLYHSGVKEMTASKRIEELFRLNEDY